MVNTGKTIRRLVSVALAFLIGIAMISIAGNLRFPNAWDGQVAMAQRVRTEGIWKSVYERVPNLPLENQYVNIETKQVDSDNTLVGRLIRYHVYVKGRSPWLRFDWKLTLADYLGVNEPMEESTYPSRDTLRKSPYEGDIAVINGFNREQRGALVQALVDAFSAQITRPRQSASPTASPSTSPSQPAPIAPSPTPKPITKPVRGPGAAELLLP